MKKKIRILFLTILLGLTAVLLIPHEVQGGAYRATNPNKHIATVFIHGFGGSARSTDNLIEHSQADGYATRGVRAIVGLDGSVRLEGQITKSMDNPTVQIVLIRNHELYYQRSARSLQKVLRLVSKKYDIRQFYTVSHSWGNNALIYYQMFLAKQDPEFQIKKMMTIAAPIKYYPESRHAWNPNYQRIIDDDYHRYQTWPGVSPMHNVRILNVMGDLNNSGFDGRVPNYSSAGVKELFAKKAKSFQTLKVSGDNAEHSALTRRNPTVVRHMEQFLWTK